MFVEQRRERLAQAQANVVHEPNHFRDTLAQTQSALEAVQTRLEVFEPRLQLLEQQNAREERGGWMS